MSFYRSSYKYRHISSHLNFKATLIQFGMSIILLNIDIKSYTAFVWSFLLKTLFSYFHMPSASSKSLVRCFRKLCSRQLATQEAVSIKFELSSFPSIRPAIVSCAHISPSHRNQAPPACLIKSSDHPIPASILVAQSKCFPSHCTKASESSSKKNQFAICGWQEMALPSTSVVNDAPSKVQSASCMCYFKTSTPTSATTEFRWRKWNLIISWSARECYGPLSWFKDDNPCTPWT